MFKNKYSTLLTVVLVILIIAIIVIITMLGINAYKKYEDEKKSKKIFSELTEENYDNNTTEEKEENVPIQPIEGSNTTNNSNGGGTTTVARPKTKFYNDYPMIGYIKIPKTKTEYPILIDVSPGALETAVGVMYPSNPSLNEPGNVVIIGHNYRNGKFFSNNKNLVIGDKIQITDLTGRTLTYTIYEIFQTSESDTEYITRNRGNNTEISLSTCTDDGTERLVILARVQ